jgi:hypothetical protein
VEWKREKNLSSELRLSIGIHSTSFSSTGGLCELCQLLSCRFELIGRTVSNGLMRLGEIWGTWERDRFEIGEILTLLGLECFEEFEKIDEEV